MEHIREAIERAKTAQPAGDEPRFETLDPPANEDRRGQRAVVSPRVEPSSHEVWLDAAQLEDHRIIAHDIGDVRSKSIDMLRTQVLQTMDANSWKVLGVTSPMPGCGKSVLAVNLALSIARRPERAVLLVDLDFQRPQVARYLGLKCANGVLSVLSGRSKLSDNIAKARIGDQQIFLLPCEESRLNSSELMASYAMNSTLQEIRRRFDDCTIILDLPPVLPSDDVLSILPQLDSVLLVAAAGESTIPEIKECNSHLESVPIVRFVLNKSTEKNLKYYRRYGRYGNSK